MDGGKQRKWTLQKVLGSWQLYVLLLPAVIWLVLFAYYPMYGLLIAFKDFKGRMGILGSPWAEPLFKHFETFFSTSIAVNAIWNTVAISVLTLLVGFPVPVIFALLLNQIRHTKVRKAVQTISYAPYFLSTVVIVSIISMLFSANGLVNGVVTSTGEKEIFFTSQPEWFRPLYIGSSVWQSMGFNAIIYIAALVGISPEYYEAAIVDGATRFQRIMRIDLPLILPTVILMLILNVGNIMNVGYEKAFLMQNSMNTTVSELISTYVYKVGLQQAQYSFATAVGLFNSVVNFILLVIVNFVSKKFSDISIF
ncbi:sugar ABC transporter permease [Acutalibacter sp. 1XD8-33]|uniref:ABC transporter permease n=1 Tax=Acutalibacter sp. 1XD8-33 TaxID=2320081 RepID=UPI000EA305FC|nr:ABC transporter permease subunit [Acutalibacter sp. 1XD8-33]RKJ40797.1 sugar ABC transporter permease [Acutalibacter sp. 1XD8-33]